jgi:hypothetical protein
MIRVISPAFEFLGEIDNYESLQFTRRFFRPGEFELHMNIKKGFTDELVEDNLIQLDRDTKKVGIIRHREISQDNTETLIIKGTALSGVIGRRVTVPDAITGYDRISGSAEEVLKHYIDTNCVNPVDADRVIPQLIIAVNQNRGISTPWQTRYENLADVLQQIAEWCDIGWDVILDLVNSKWVFDVNPGRDLTAGQSILPPVIFSTEFDNIEGQAFRIDASGYKNVGYAGGQGEEEARLVLQVGDASGLDRHEVFLDCSSSETADELTANGEQALATYNKVIAYEGKVIDGGSFVYGQDWDLGDIVTVRNPKWGIAMDSRIIEVKEIYEAGNNSIEVTFGNEIPTLQSKLKKALNTPIK